MISQHRAVVRPLDEQLLGGVSRPLWVLLGAVAIVLLIACANVANLFMVRAEGRQRDLAVRRAIGAARGQLIRLQMSEALVVAVFAGLLAVGLAYVTLPVFLRAAPDGIPRIADVRITGLTWLFTLGAVFFAPSRAVPCPRFGRRRRTSRACATAHAARRAGATGRATGSSSARPRSRSCCSSRRACSFAASPSCGTSTPATTRRTSSRFRSRPKARICPTVRPTRGSIWRSWIG